MGGRITKHFISEIYSGHWNCVVKFSWCCLKAARFFNVPSFLLPVGCVFHLLYFYVQARRDVKYFNIFLTFYPYCFSFLPNVSMLNVFRRMFPVPDFCLAGLEPDQYYGCSVEVVAVDPNRYRHKPDQGWVSAGKGIQLDHTHSKYLHVNSASLGQYWMAQGATFDKLKLSNHIVPNSDNVSDLRLAYNQRYTLLFAFYKNIEVDIREFVRWF